MKVPIRIIAPVVTALVCAGCLVVFLWWQLTKSTEIIRTVSLQKQEEQSESIFPVDTTDEIIDPADIVLSSMRQGDLLALRGDWANAETAYRKAVDAKGGIPALRKLAQAQLQRRDLDGVSKTIRALREAGAKSEDLLLLESIVNLRKGELVKARNLLQNTAESPQKHYGLALLAMIEGNHTVAESELKEVMNGWEPVLRSHAKTLHAAYEEFGLFPESPEIHLVTLLSRALAQVQECELALPLLLQVTSERDNYRDAWIVQGYCELVTERPEQAMRSLEQAYMIDPQKSETQYFLGRAYAALGDSANAITFYEYAIANGFTPESEVRTYIAEEALETENYELALQQFLLLTELSDATLESYEGYVTTSIALERFDEAYASAIKASEKWENTPGALVLLGTAAEAAGKTDDAIRAYSKAVELDPFLLDIQDRIKKLQ